MAAHRFLYIKRRITSSHPVIFKSNRRAKAGHYPVAFCAGNPFVAVNDRDHGIDDRLQNAPCIFRISAPDQCRRTSDVGEQDRCKLAFTLARRERTPDPLRKMPRDLNVGKADAHPCKRSTALAAVPLVSAHRRTTTGTALVQALTARHTVIHLVVVESALQATVDRTV